MNQPIMAPPQGFGGAAVVQTMDFDPLKDTVIFEDFLDTDGLVASPAIFCASRTNWRQTVSGGVLSTSIGEDSHPGFLSERVAAVGNVVTVNMTNRFHANDGIILEAQVKLQTAVPGAVDDYKVFVGISDDDTLANVPDPTNAIGFMIERSQYATNWYTLTAASSVRTRNDSGVAFTTNWTKLRFVKVGSSVQFYINDVLVATHTTNLPASGGASYLVMVIKKTVGTNIRYLYTDYIYLKQTLATPR